jgi:UDP-N-acetylmuramoyl-tripeptide--D-alanyl-D-alanine ligase
MSGFLFFLLFFYLLVQLILSHLFYLYLWQIKEYRLDRLLCHLKTRTGKRQFFAYLNILRWKGIRRPIFTFKAILIFLLGLTFKFRLGFFILRQLSCDFWVRALIVVLMLVILSPLITTLSVFLLTPVTLVLKKMITLLAKKKISLLPDLMVIGVTGSYGKSSTKEMIATLLSEKYRVLKTPKNWNTEIGVAKTALRSLNKKHQVFVVEMAAYKKGEIEQICNLVKPQIGMMTGINEQHLGLFGSLGDIMKAKHELIESLPEKGLAVFNADNPYCLKLAEKTTIRKKLYSVKDVERVRVGRKTVTFSFNNQPFKLNLLGEFNIANFLAAYWVARELGLSEAEIFRGSEKIKPFPGTMKPFSGKNGGFFIDDTYSCNPQGFLAALDYLEKQKGRKMVVTPGMIELGQAASRIHQELARKLGSVADLVILTKKEFVKEMKSEIKNLVIEEDPRHVLEILDGEVKKNDIVLLEGRLPEIILEHVQ